MDLLSTATACLLFVSAPLACHTGSSEPLRPGPTVGARIPQWDGFIAEAALRFAIPADRIRCVMAQESGGFTMLHGRPITSPKGAMGLMQLMPETWGDMRARYGLGADPYNPHDNILAGAAFLRILRDRFGEEGAFAAYNAGPARYAAYLQGAGPLPAETRAYLARITTKGSSQTALPAVGSLFIRLSTSTESSRFSPADDAMTATGAALFVPLTK